MAVAPRWKKKLFAVIGLSLAVTLFMINYTWNNNSHNEVLDVDKQLAELPPLVELSDPQHNGFRRIAHFGAKIQDLDNANPFWRRFGNKSRSAKIIKVNDAESFGDVQFFGAEKDKGSYPKKSKYPLKQNPIGAGDSGVDSSRDEKTEIAKQQKPVKLNTTQERGAVMKENGAKFENDSATNVRGKSQSGGSQVHEFGLHAYPTKSRPEDFKEIKGQAERNENPYPTKPKPSNDNVYKYPTKAPTGAGLQQSMDTPFQNQPLAHEEQPAEIAVNNISDVKQFFTPMPRIEGENVIAITLYGSSMRYTMGAIRNAELARENFPGWKLRVYTEAPSESPRHGIVPQTVISKLRDLGADIHYMQPGEDFVPPMMWRFLVADDMWVDRFIVRDADSRLTERDAAAVYAWVKSDRPFNCIRDHPSHAAYAISGGMWGGKPRALQNLLRRSWKDMMRHIRSDYLQDMNFLNYVVWPKVQSQAYCSDSVSCEQFPGAHPFPVPRLGYEHVGQVFNEQDLGRPDDIQILRTAGENHKCVPNVDIKQLLRNA